MAPSHPPTPGDGPQSPRYALSFKTYTLELLPVCDFPGLEVSVSSISSRNSVPAAPALLQSSPSYSYTVISQLEFCTLRAAG